MAFDIGHFQAALGQPQGIDARLNLYQLHARIDQSPSNMSPLMPLAQSRYKSLIRPAPKP